MSRSKELMDDAFKSAEECGIDITDKYAYASGYLTAIIEDLEQTNLKLRDELNKKTGNKILDAIIRDTKFTDLEEKSDRDFLVDSLREYIRQLEKLEYECASCPTLWKEEAEA
jgi:hypothetical protein